MPYFDFTFQMFLIFIIVSFSLLMFFVPGKILVIFLNKNDNISNSSFHHLEFSLMEK